MLRFTLLSAVFSAAAVRASISSSILPNLACAGAGSAVGGFVGVGQVTLPNGDVEQHCGCVSDGLDNFEVCPSSTVGQSVCNSAYNLDSNVFTASCGVAACSSAECRDDVVNTVSYDQDECYNSEKGAIGIVSVDGEVQCGCAADALDADFTACASPANGHAVCRSTDSDYLGVAQTHSDKVSCAVVCDDGFFLTPGGSCVNFQKRQVVGPSGTFHTAGPGKVGPSSAWTPATSIPIKVGPSSSFHGSSSATTTTASPTSRHPHAAHTTSHSGDTSSATTTSYSYKHHHVSSDSSSSHGGSSTHPNWRSTPIKVGPSATPSTASSSSHSASSSSRVHHHSNGHGSSSVHHHHGSSTHQSWHSTAVPIDAVPIPTTSSTFTKTRGPGKVGPSAIFTDGPGKVGPSQRARRAAEEFVFSDVCAQDERTCSVVAGDFGDFACVRLDDVTQCGGCESTGEATNCLAIKGASSVACLRGGCVVRSCQTGFVQTSEGTCEAKA